MFALSRLRERVRGEGAPTTLPRTLLTLLALLPALTLGACAKRDQDEQLLSRVRGALAERERKIVSYRFEGVTVQGDERAEYSFAFRAPKRMRADFRETGISFAFDGSHLVQWDARNRVFTRIDLEGASREAAALFLHRTFSPFAPEGWRTPLLAGELSARFDPTGETRRVAVSAHARDAEQDFEVTWFFSPPGMDFDGKSAQGGGAVKVLSQHCDKSLGLCFPSKVEEARPGAPAAITELTKIEVNVALPPELFELKPPEGARVETRSLQ